MKSGEEKKKNKAKSGSVCEKIEEKNKLDAAEKTRKNKEECEERKKRDEEAAVQNRAAEKMRKNKDELKERKKRDEAAAAENLKKAEDEAKKSELRKKCRRDECNFVKHSDQNDHEYCCRNCKEGKEHGKYCEKTQCAQTQQIVAVTAPAAGVDTTLSCWTLLLLFRASRSILNCANSALVVDI